MLPLKSLNSRKRAISSQSSYDYVNEVVERGSPRACLSALLVAIMVMFTLWFGHFASVRAKPAWAAIEHEAISLRRELGVSDALASPRTAASH
jgi:hypothetical protein